MRLLNSKTLKLHEFEQSTSTIPRYAILSHTWDDGEITYRDIRSRSAKELASKKGYTKIAHACRKAQENNLDYVWIDTCCIDKSSSAELSESINSMFKWYANAFICYVFLSDLVDSVEFHDCRWWTRGWTLQELIAPERVVFFDAKWEFYGDKKSLIESISDISGIEQKVLLDKHEMFSCTVSQKMSWAADRETKLVEDEAYCLLGIFNINMPLLYGEGRKAFRRLQEEIIKRTTDLTIFHWYAPRDELDAQYTSLIAESPSAFRLRTLKSTTLEFPEFSITNKGVFFSNVTDLALIKGPRGNDVKYGFLLGWDYLKVPSAIMLRKVRPGIFCRDGHCPVRGDGRPLERRDMAVLSAKNDFYILTDPGPATEKAIIQSRSRAIRLPHDEQFQLHCVVPNETWDATDRVFLLTPTRNRFGYHLEWHYPVILAMAFSTRVGQTNIQLVVLSINEIGLIIFERERYPEQSEILFAEQNREKSIPQSDLRKLMPDIASLGNSVQVRLPANWMAHITVIIQPGTLHVVSEELRVWDIGFTVEYQREEIHW